MASNAEDLLSCAICLEHFQVSDFTLRFGSKSGSLFYVSRSRNVKFTEKEDMTH